MIEDMTIRGFAPKTRTGYIRAVEDFTAFLGRAPDRASADDLARGPAAHEIGRGLPDQHKRRRFGPALLLHGEPGRRP
ncbi:MAG: hypothetical protein QF926_01875 [Alphaproteobacteria bacterium]|nr:hypothetical protein [Alphaproteobacteria bacterium]